MGRVRFSFLPWLACALAGAQNIYTVAGLPYTHRDSVDGKPALSAPLGNSVYGLLFDKITGRLLFDDQLLVMRLEPDGTLLTVAGVGRSPSGTTIDGTLSSNLNVGFLRGMAEDASGALYLSDGGAGRVYRIALDGTVGTFAGGGKLDPGFASDGGPATAAHLGSPRGLVFDSQGSLNIAEVYCGCIRRVSTAGIISTVYTIPQPSQPGSFHEIEGLTIDSQDNLYLTEWMGHTVIKITASGSATTVAGTGTAGFSGDGGPATAAQLNGPSGVTFDIYGNLYIADSMNHRIRRVAVDGTISTIAGTGVCGLTGDGGPATAAQLCVPAETVFDGSGNLYVSDYSNARVRKIACVVTVFSCGSVPDGTITTIAGSGQSDPNLFLQGSTGDGGSALHATFNRIGAVVFDTPGNLYVSDSGGNSIRKIAPDGTIGTFAGAGQPGSTGGQAQLTHPGPLAFGPNGSLYVVTGDSRIWKITPDANITLVAGTGTGTGINRAQGDGGPAVNATLNEPGGMAFDKQGNLYIADTSNARVRKVDSNGIITTVAGPGQPGVDYYNAVAVDPQGNLYVAWTHAAVYPAVATNAIFGTVNRVNSDGSLTPVAGNGQPCPGGPFGQQFAFDGASALQAQLCEVPSMTMDAKGIMYLAYGSQVLQVTTDGIIHVVAGDALATVTGDGGPELQASFDSGGPGTPAFDTSGNMFIPEPGNALIREVTATPLALKLSVDHINLQNQGPQQSQTVAVSANFAEPFPYQVKVSTADGGSWLSANRVAGQTGESFTVTWQSGVPSGIYHGTVSVILASPTPQQVDVPVTFTSTPVLVNP